MAGSYHHVLDDDGNLVENARFVDMIDNLGDAYELVVDMDRIIRQREDEIAELLMEIGGA